MMYILRYRRKEVASKFNRDRLILSAIQNKDQLYFMMDTEFDGIYQREAVERKRQYGENTLKLSGRNKDIRLLPIKYKELENLVTELSRQKVAVFRKNMELYVEIECRDVVPGDMIFLTSGDIVPADVRIIYENGLYVDQHVFTGIKDKIKKGPTTSGYSCSMFSIIDIPNICLMGTRIVGGVARAVAIGTGSATYLGKLVYGY